MFDLEKYIELIRKFPPRHINNEEEYDKCVEVLNWINSIPKDIYKAWEDVNTQNVEKG